MYRYSVFQKMEEEKWAMALNDLTAHTPFKRKFKVDFLIFSIPLFSLRLFEHQVIDPGVRPDNTTNLSAWFSVSIAD